MHVITGLSSGGAESMLSALATADLADGMDVLVVTLVPGGLYHERLLAESVGHAGIVEDGANGRPVPADDHTSMAEWRLAVFSRPALAGAVLQTAAGSATSRSALAAHRDGLVGASRQGDLHA